jgi:hypothetical protein
VAHPMPKFVTIGYGNEAGYNRLSEDARAVAHAHDAQLREQGAEMGIAGGPVQVRNHNGCGVESASGPFLKSELPIAGFALIEAANMEEAIKMVSGTPCAVAYGVVEVWPLQETVG